MSDIQIKLLEIVGNIPTEVWIVLGVLLAISIIISIIKKAVKLIITLLILGTIFGGGGVYVENIKDKLVNTPINSITEGVSEEMQNKIQELKDKYTIEIQEKGE